ncbi:MAG: hypothetical protein AAB940_00100, partial [Patescibacteria group bacterium]
MHNETILSKLFIIYLYGNAKLFLQPAHRFISENCFEEHPAGAASLVPAKRDCRAEGEENFAAG